MLLLNSKIFIMKRILHFVIIGAMALLNAEELKAQSQVYFREGFNDGEGELPNAAATSVPGRYILQSNSGTWYTYGMFRTNGPTGSCQTQTGGLTHARFANLNAITTTDDSAYMITPVVNAGINTLSYYNGRALRRLTILKTSDTLATTLNWTIVEVQPATNTACQLYTITVNDPSAKRLKIIARAGTDSDIDSLVLTSTSVLPVTFISFSAIEATGKVKVSWNILTEINTARYEVERSIDGITFINAGTITASQAGVYSWLDNSPIKGSNFYRIKAIDKDGSAMYSNVLKIIIGGRKGTIQISPNPIKGSQINLQVADVARGIYTINLYNTIGQVVFTKNLEINGGTTIFPLQLPAGIKGGIYNLQLRNGAVVISKKVVVE